MGLRTKVLQCCYVLLISKCIVHLQMPPAWEGMRKCMVSA